MSVSDPTAAQPTTAEQLPGDVATLRQMVLELLATVRQERHDNASLRHRLDALLRRLYGPRSERYDPLQLLLFADLAAAAEPPTPTPAELPERPKSPRRCRPHGRRRLPEHLPRESRHHTLSEAECVCRGCGGRRQDIGVARSEQLEYRPASLFVIEHLVHKYACPNCVAAAHAASAGAPEVPAMATPPPASLPPQPPPAEPLAAATPSASVVAAEASPPTPLAEPPALVIAAPRPTPPIAKGLPGPGLLAYLIVSKYTDHLPLYRLERICERQGVFLSRSTLSDWLGASADLLTPLYALLMAGVLRSRALHTDDTPVKLQDPKTHQLSTARLWAYLGDAQHPYNVFDFTVNRKRDGPETFLAKYKGYLHADAFGGYDRLYLPDPETSSARIVEVACNAHARRKFYEARSSDALRAHEALAYYRQLYELERAAQDFSDEQRRAMRQELSLVILEQLRGWLESQRADVLPKSPLGEAIGYALNNWSALIRYTEAGYLSIDNNVAEREMKRIAIGRKNWLTIGSVRGGRTAAVLMSFTSTCARLGVEPWRYLEDVLSRLPGLSGGALEELLPDRWQAAQKAKQSAAASSLPQSHPSGPESGS
jgi:transposase